MGEPGAKLDRRILIVFPGLMLVMLLAALDGTIVATSLPTIVTDLGGLTHISWVVTAYLLATCVSTPIYGKLGDLYGRKRLFQFAIVLFLAGSALCGISRSLTELVIFRGLQGLGAGGLMVNSQAVIGDLVPPAERGRYQGFMQSMFALATVAGPLIGGVLTQDLSWRWVFYVNLPLGAIALVVITSVLKLPVRTGPKPKIDWWGAALLSTGVAALILLTSSVGSAFPWLSVPVFGLSIGAVVLLVAFVLVERRSTEPLMPLRLFRNNVIKITAPLVFVVGFGMFGITTFMPLYEQLVDGASPTMSGLRLAPLMLCMMISSVACGQIIARIGRYRKFPIAGTALLTCGAVLLSLIGVSTSYGFQLIALGVVGLGLGMINPVMVLANQNAVEATDIGVATSITTFGRTVGSSFGVAVFGAIFANRLTSSLQHNLPAGVVAQFSRSGINISRAQIDALPAKLQADFLAGFGNALHDVFLCAVIVAALGFLLAIRLREVPLRRRTAVEEDTKAAVGEGSARAAIVEEGLTVTVVADDTRAAVVEKPFPGVRTPRA
ncbi:MAG TPA: MDR family MFS transporter [Pseudonocardiaceae bacterium]|nr:MDR family MFS transporter [Pseudonocardiaceae bacterium]